MNENKIAVEPMQEWVSHEFPLIINPDKYVASLELEEPPLNYMHIPPAAERRQMCQACIFGQHQFCTCEHKDCICKGEFILAQKGSRIHGLTHTQRGSARYDFMKSLELTTKPKRETVS